MNTTIISIGNSQGIRIPKIMLKESGITKHVEITAKAGEIKIKPDAKKPLADTALLSQATLSRDWDRPEEDRAWADL